MNNHEGFIYTNCTDHTTTYWNSVDFSTATYAVNVNVKLETFGGRVEEFTIRPNEKMMLITRDEALYLRTENREIPIAPLNDVMGNFDRYFMQKDKIEGMVCKANELKNSSDPMQRAIGQELLKILKDYGLMN